MLKRRLILNVVAVFVVVVAGTSLIRTVRSFYRLDFPVAWIEQGLVVSDVPPGSSAANAGLTNGDLIVSVDARQGKVAIRGWQRDTGIDAVEFARYLAREGVPRLIYTDVLRDGTLTEPNFSAISQIIEATRLPVTAAGGISSILHLKMLRRLGAEGAIIGRALYTGDIDLRQAVAAME